MTKPTGIKLTYVPAQNRYTKMVKGTRWYSTRGLTSSAKDQMEAVRQFLEWQGVQDDSKVDRRVSHAAELFRASGNDDYADELIRRAKQGEHLTSIDLRPYAHSPVSEHVFMERVRRRQNTGPKTFQHAIERFEAFKSRKMSAAGLRVMHVHLSFFQTYVQGINVKELTRETWDQFHAELSSRIGSGKWSSKYGNSVLASVKGLFRWLFDSEEIEAIPRYVGSRSYSVAVPKKRPKPFTAEELKIIFQAANDEQRLHYLLCLNCGMTQKDLSDLRPEMVDFEAGTLTRLRTKHEHQTSDLIPTVRYHLWKPVVDLLRVFAHRKGKHLLLNQAGNPLVKSCHDDAVSEGFRYLRKKTGITKPLKTFRKTGATALGSSTIYRAWREIYLANVPQGITEQHYDGTTILPFEVTEYIRTTLEIPDTVTGLR